MITTFEVTKRQNCIVRYTILFWHALNNYLKPASKPILADGMCFAFNLLDVGFHVPDN